jgi:hypothetical protein
MLKIIDHDLSVVFVFAVKMYVTTKENSVADPE